MALFYKTPADLKAVEAMILAVGQEMASVGKGYDRGEVLADMIPDTVSLMRETVHRLSSEGRSNDLSAFRKHLLSVGKYMDNAPYNKLYAPFVRENLEGQ